MDIQKLLAFLLGFHIPNPTLQSRQRFRAFRLMILIVSLASIGVAYQYYYILHGINRVTIICLSLLAVYIVDYLAFLFHKVKIVAYSVPIAGSLIALHNILIYTGGILNPGMFYIAPIIVSSYFLLGNRWGAISIIGALYEILFFYKFDELKFKLPQTLADYKLDALITTSISTAVLVMFTIIVEQTKNRTFKESELAKKKLQDSLAENEKLSLATSKTDSSIIITDKNGYIDWVNEGFEKLTGYSLADVKGTYGEILRHGEKTSLSDPNIINEIIREKKAITYVERNYKKNGAAYWVATTLTPIFDNEGELKNFVAIDADITDRKQIEEELVKAMGIAEESVNNQRQLMSVLSNEIRTPLTSMIKLTDKLAELKLTEEQDAIVRTMHMSASTLEMTLNDVLSFSRLRTRKDIVNLQTVDISETVRLQMLEVVALADKKGINMQISNLLPPHLQVETDKDILIQLINILTQTALAHTEYGDLQLVSTLQPITQNSSSLVFTFKGIGKGVPANRLSNLTNKINSVTVTDDYFSQNNNQVQDMGPEIAKKLLKVLGGQIGIIANDENNNMDLWFTIKVKEIAVNA